MHTQIGTDIHHAIDLLKAGELVAIPTETVYGLAANALNPEAVLRIYETKGRPTFNPLIVHVHDFGEFEKYASEVHPMIKTLAEKFSPGPLTYVLPKKSIVPDIVTGGGDTVALRVPGHPLTLKLLSQLDFPLAAPSANPFGYISPVLAEHVAEQLNGKIPYILDGGHSMIGLESTVVTVENDKLIVLRVGGVPIEELHETVGDLELRINMSSNPKSPGQLRSHYAPRIPLMMGDLPQMIQSQAGKKIALLVFSERNHASNVVAQEVLSPSRDIKEAARNLFAALRRLDKSSADVILAERFPEFGFGLAINDRLERAAAKD
jgi:L-threonylcarbamoyladenylate synthase